MFLLHKKTKAQKAVAPSGGNQLNYVKVIPVFNTKASNCNKMELLIKKLARTLAPEKTGILIKQY